MSLFRLEVDLPPSTPPATFARLADVLEHHHCKHVPDDSGPALTMPGRSVFFTESPDTEAALQQTFADLVHKTLGSEAQVFVKQIPEESEG